MDSVYLQAGGYNPSPEIQIHHFGDHTVEDVEREWSQEQSKVQTPARGIMNCLYSLAKVNADG